MVFEVLVGLGTVTIPVSVTAVEVCPPLELVVIPACFVKQRVALLHCRHTPSRFCTLLRVVVFVFQFAHLGRRLLYALMAFVALFSAMRSFLLMRYRLFAHASLRCLLWRWRLRVLVNSYFARLLASGARLVRKLYFSRAVSAFIDLSTGQQWTEKQRSKKKSSEFFH